MRKGKTRRRKGKTRRWRGRSGDESRVRRQRSEAKKDEDEFEWRKISSSGDR